MKLHPGTLEAVRQYLEREGIPTETQETILGLLRSVVTTPEGETPSDEKTLIRLAEALSDKDGLLRRIQQQAAELDALKRITFNLTSSLELQAVLDGVVKEALNLTRDAQNALIFLYQNQKLVFGASLTREGVRNADYSPPRTGGLTYQVANTRQMMIIENMQEHALYQDAPVLACGSVIGLPLKMGDRVIGVMNLVRKQRGAFSQNEIQLLSLLAEQASIAIINARLHQAVSQQARSDVLTGLPNRRALDERLEEEIMRSKRSGHPFCVIMMDLDGFKAVNDTYGHDTGDEVLRQVAKALQDNLRGTDFLARYGGDELTLVLPETSLEQTQVVIAKIRDTLASLMLTMPDGATISMGISGGMAQYPIHAETPPGLIRASDEGLYRAKKRGGGAFVVALNGHA